MRIRWHSTIIVLIVLTLLIASIGGVFATWEYKYGVTSPVNASINSKLFLWHEVPKDEGGKIIEETGTQVESSLNNGSSELNSAITLKEIFGLTTVSSADNIHGDQIRTELGLDPKASFLMEFPDSNTRVLYSTTVEIGGQSGYGSPTYAIPEGEWIYPVYKTVVKLNATTSKWEQQSTQRGYAKSSSYVTFISSSPLFNANTWTRGKIGTGIDNAIYVYYGQNVSVPLDSTKEKVFFKFNETAANTTYTISSSTKGAKIVLLDPYGKTIKNKNNGTNKVTYKATSKGELIYIRITGATDINFIVQ